MDQVVHKECERKKKKVTKITSSHSLTNCHELVQRVQEAEMHLQLKLVGQKLHTHPPQKVVNLVAIKIIDATILHWYLTKCVLGKRSVQLVPNFPTTVSTHGPRITGCLPNIQDCVTGPTFWKVSALPNFHTPHKLPQLHKIPPHAPTLQVIVYIQGIEWHSVLFPHPCHPHKISLQ